MRSPALIILAVLCLTACVDAPTVYQPLSADTHVGYQESPIEQDRWRIVFAGGPGADPARVADLALRRAAELTLARGGDWFRVTQRATERRAGNGPYVSLGAGGADFGRHSAVGVGGDVGFDLGGGPRTIQTLEILIGRGPAPREPDVYDAHDVARTLGAPA